MYLDLLKANIQENHHLGHEKVFESVKTWLGSRGFKEDDFSDPVFVDKQKLEILEQTDWDKVREEAFYEGVDHVLDQLRIINPYGDRNGFLDD